MTLMPGILIGSNVVNPGAQSPKLTAVVKHTLLNVLPSNQVLGKVAIPFKNIKLDRADVEWLLATHEHGRGPVDWSDEHQHERAGLDMRGADQKQADLRSLPLACMCGGLTWYPRNSWTSLKEHLDMAAVHLEGADLSGAHLEGACLRGAHLEKVRLNGAHIEDSDLSGAYMQEAILRDAHIERASLVRTRLDGGILIKAHLEGAYLPGTHLEGAALYKAT